MLGTKGKMWSKMCVRVRVWVGGWLSVRARTDQIDKVYNRRYTTTRKWYDKEALNLYDWQSPLLRIWLRGPSQSRFPTTNGLCICVYVYVLACLFICLFVCLSIDIVNRKCYYFSNGARSFRFPFVRLFLVFVEKYNLFLRIDVSFHPTHLYRWIHLPTLQFNSSLDF